MSDNIHILVYGLGAYILSRTESVKITVVARSNYEVVKKNGINLKSKVYGDVVLRPYSVVQTIKEASTTSPAPYDYVVFTHKALPGAENVPKDLALVMGDETTIVIMQNGIGNEDAFRTVLPGNTIITCSLWMTATQTSPGIVEHNTSIKTPLGLFPSPTPNPNSDPLSQTRLQAFTTLLITGLMPTQIHSDMQIQKWEKVVWNAAFNSLTALTQLDTLAWLHSSPEAKGMTGRLMREIMAVARRCGVCVKEDLDAVLMEQVLGLGGIRSSMMVDVAAGRLLEVEAIFGGPLRLAKEKGVDVPTLELVYALLTGINVRTLQKRESV